MNEFLSYPIEIQRIFLFEQKRQTGKENVNVFLDYYAAGKADGGFLWNAALYNHLSLDSSKFRDTVSLMNKTPNNYEKIIEFYKHHIPGLVGALEEVKVDGITVIL